MIDIALTTEFVITAGDDRGRPDHQVVYRGAVVGVAAVAAVASSEHAYALVRATRPPVWDLLGLYGLVVALPPTAPNISCWSVVNPDWCWVIVAIKIRSGGSKHAQEDLRV